MAALAAAAAPAPAQATPVATNDAQYSQYGRVFPDPLAGCVASPCSPNAQGNQAATQFIQYPELIAGLRYLSSKPKWRRYLEVLPLDGKLGDGAGTDERKAFPGNDRGRFEFRPSAKYHSAGLPQTGTARKTSDLIMVRVTDESVPDKGKKRYAISLSIHGIERAGAEGGTRSIEDYVTAASTGRLNRGILAPGSTTHIPTYRDVLRKAIVYYTYPNPDGWRRGDVSEGGVFFQRYNGNGVDENRDWPDIGFSFRPYSPVSEPETRAFSSALQAVSRRAGTFDQGADLHGQLEADALSFTLLPHGRHDFGKNLRIRSVAQTIHSASEKALAWSPIIQPNDAPRGGGAPCAPGAAGDTCARIYGQTWGTVYDTINYTTTGALGDWFDSPVGLDANGIDNEMSFSHLDKNIVFDPHTEQLHVDGNKALINAQLTRMLNPPRGTFDVAGSKGYVPNTRLKRKFKRLQSTPPSGTKPQADITGVERTPDPTALGQTIFPIDVKRSRKIFNGGMRVEITNLNAQGVGPGAVSLAIQCRGCDLSRHPGEKSGDWVTVTQDFNQSPAYLQAGVTAAVNEPQAFNGKGKKVQWRAAVGQGGLRSRMDVHFTAGPATSSGETGSGKAKPPTLLAYDVADTDFFRDLNRFLPRKAERFHTVSPKRVAAGRQSLAGLDSLALADNPFPGKSSATQRAKWYAALRAWVTKGGTLVLTDGALRALPRLTSIPASSVGRITTYVGQVSFSKDSGSDTLNDPLNRGVKIQGARFNTGMRRQTYEPVPVGFSIQDDAGNDQSHSPQWQVNRAAWEKAGGRTAATSVANDDVNGANDYDQTAYGELKLGRGVIRILASGLPQPTTTFDHDFGLSPYSATYTTYILMRNMLKPVRQLCSDAQRPRGFIDKGSLKASRSVVSVNGTATDLGCGANGRGTITEVRVAMATRTHHPGRCRHSKPGGGYTPPRACTPRVYIHANGRGQWSFTYNHAMTPGTYTMRVRARDGAGNVSRGSRKATYHFVIP